MASRIARSATLRGQTEPEPETKVGEPPEHLKEDAQVVWAEMTREGRLRLTGADRLQVEIVAQLMAEFRRGRHAVEQGVNSCRSIEQVGLRPDRAFEDQSPAGERTTEKPI